MEGFFDNFILYTLSFFVGWLICSYRSFIFFGGGGGRRSTSVYTLLGYLSIGWEDGSWDERRVDGRLCRKEG